MKYTIIAAAIAAFASQVGAVGVVGAAEGFAKGVTGGGSASPVYPSTTAQLISYLADSSPRVIVLTKTFDFTGTEGTATSDGCSPWGTGSACQQAINKDNWCTNYQPNAPKVSGIKYDKAGMLGMTVASNKSLIGQGSKGVIKGKGIRIVNGAKNIIVQNVRFTEINPKYVWGGDAITVDGGMYSSNPFEAFKILIAAQVTLSGLTMLPPISSLASTLFLVTTPPAVSPSPTARSMVLPPGLPLAMVTTTGHSTSPAPTTWSPSRTTTSTTPLAARPRLVATPSFTLSTTTSTLAPSTCWRRTLVPMHSTRVTFSRTSTLPSRLVLPERLSLLQTLLRLRPARHLLAALASSTPTVHLVPSQVLTLASWATSRARTLRLPVLLPTPRTLSTLLAMAVSKCGQLHSGKCLI